MSLNNIPRVLHTTVVHDNDFFQLRKERLELTPHDSYDYYTIEAAPFAVMVIATTPQNEYVLNWEYRHPVKSILLSCPGGIMHAGETPLSCAARELLEETGYEAEHFEIIGEAHPFPGICAQKTIYVRAHNAKFSGPQQLDQMELIEPALFSPEHLKKTLESQIPIDGLLLSALFLASLKP